MSAAKLSYQSLSDINPLDYQSLHKLREAYFLAVPEICVERPALLTRYHRDNGLFEQEKISVLDKAKAYRFVLENREPVVRHSIAHTKKMKAFSVEDSSPFAGSTTSKFKGVPLYPELIGSILWPELSTVSSRPSNPFHITEGQAAILNTEVFPHWMKRTIWEITRETYYGKNLGTLGNDEMKLFQNLVFFLTSKPICISHTIPDFSRAIQEGLRSVIDKAQQKKREAPDPKQQEFYEAISTVLEGMIGFAHNISVKARRMTRKEPADSLKRKQLEEIADIYAWVPEFPARTFREGLTTVWICWIAAHLENFNAGLSLGRLDQILFDLYRRDIEEQRLTPQKAVELVSYFWLKIGDHVPGMPETGEQLFGGTGSNQAITIGGVDGDTKDAVNDLTYVMLKATELMQLRDPNLNARYYPKINSRSYLEALCEVNVATGATPAIHNDKAIIRALEAQHDKPENARDYGIVGCVEPCSNGRHYGHSGAVLLNLASALELAMYNGRHRRIGIGHDQPPISFETGTPADLDTFDKFRDAFGKQLDWIIDRATTLNHHFGRTHQQFYPTPILSALFKGPMESGKDVIEGGAEINSSGAAIIGLADVADSLSAVEKVVYTDKRIALPDLLAALEQNFSENGEYFDRIDNMKKSYKALHKLLSNPAKTPKFGNEDAQADANVTWIVNRLSDVLTAKENYRNGTYRVGYWTMTIHAGFGKLTGALPNGRKAHENFSSGITPVSMVTPSLTKALNSVAGLPARSISSGMAFNLKFVPNDGDEPTMIKTFADTVEAYFAEDDDEKDGGVEIQFNIITRDRFIKAVYDPTKHDDFLVRVSGYTAYFKDLNPTMQKEIIDRTEYLLSKKEMCIHEPFELK
jgi:pyruvate formate-lyase/glycerol dehydratase family glycyl radical enzyme